MELAKTARRWDAASMRAINRMTRQSWFIWLGVGLRVAIIVHLTLGVFVVLTDFTEWFGVYMDGAYERAEGKPVARYALSSGSVGLAMGFVWLSRKIFTILFPPAERRLTTPEEGLA